MVFGRGDDSVIILEFEKIYRTLLLMQKKKYAGEKWEKGRDGHMHLSERVASSGIETARRDPPPIVADVVSYALEQLLEGDETVSVRDRLARVSVHVDSVVTRIRDGTMSFDRLIQSKKLSANVETYRKRARTVPLHVDLTERQMKRQRSGEESIVVAQPGDRVAYVMVEPAVGRERTAKKTTLAEDPMYAWKNNVSLNQKHYIDAIESALARVLECVLASETHARTVGEGNRRVLASLSAYLNVAPAGLRPVASGAASLSFARVRRCGVCSQKMRGDGAVCEVCERTRPDDVCARANERTERRNTIYDERSHLYDKCLACMRSTCGDAAADARGPLGDVEDLNTAIGCDSADCENMFKRLANDRQRRRLEST